MESTREFMQRYIDAIGESKSPEVIDQYVADDELKEHIAMFEAAFPGYDLDLQDLLIDGDKATLRAMFRGVHRGDFLGRAPTGRDVSVPLIIIYRVAAGKIVEHWMQADMMSLLQQLDATPAAR